MRCLEAIAAQQIDEEFEVVVIDSGSTDGTAERARERTARACTRSRPAEFHHGRTRNLRRAQARGEILVWTTHDAYPGARRLARRC